MNGIRYRLQHLAGRVERDLAGMREVAPVERRLAERLAEYPNGAEPVTLQELWFMIEELRLAVFAQELGLRIRSARFDFFVGWGEMPAWEDESFNHVISRR